MTGIKDFESVNGSLKTYTHDVFKTRTDIETVGQPMSFPTGDNLTRIYNINGKFLLYFGDKKLYRINTGILTAFSNKVLEEEPIIISVPVNGDDKELVISDACFLDGTELPAGTVPSCEFATYAFGSVFIGCGRELRFTKRFDVDNGSVNIDFDGYFKTEDEDGEIIYAYLRGNRLCLLTEYKIMEFSPFGDKEDAYITRVSLPYFKAQKNTAINVGSALLFLYGDKLCKYYKGGFNVVGSVPVSGFSVKGRASECDGLYLLPLTKDGEDYVYFFDVENGTDGLVSGGKALSFRGGYYTDTQNGRVMKFKKKICGAENFTSDLNLCGIKRIAGIEIHVKGSGKLKVTGDSGFSEFTLKNGCNVLFCKLYSDKFNFEITDRSNGFSVEKFLIKYKNQELK